MLLQQDLDDLDADIFKPKKKSVAGPGKTLPATPAAKPDPTPSKMEQPPTKPSGKLNISHAVSLCP